MAQSQVIEHPQKDYQAQPSTVTVRVCKGCGKHYVGLMKRKAEEEAMAMVREAQRNIKSDLGKVRELTLEAHILMDSAGGYCRPCSVNRWQGWGSKS